MMLTREEPVMMSRVWFQSTSCLKHTSRALACVEDGVVCGAGERRRCY